MITWDILIRSVPPRHHKLCDLLDGLNAQMLPGVGVLVFRDNFEMSPGRKCQVLLEASGAQYVSFVDDDDMVRADYVPLIVEALESNPDYVGFPVICSISGMYVFTVEHSLRHGGWFQDSDGRLFRDISHLNPIRRELALLGTFEGGHGEDRRWADEVRDSSRVRREVWIPDPIYHYRYSAADSLARSSGMLSVQDLAAVSSCQAPPLPKYPWLVQVKLENR